METLNHKGRYLKALIDNPQYIPAKKGDLFLIITVDRIIKEAKNDNNWNYCESKIGTTWELMPEDFNPEKEELLEEAKRTYPIGTEFICANGNEGINVVKEELYWQGSGITHTGILWVYYLGKWAEILESPEKEEVSQLEKTSDSAFSIGIAVHEQLQTGIDGLQPPKKENKIFDEKQYLNKDFNKELVLSRKEVKKKTLILEPLPF